MYRLLWGKNEGETMTILTMFLAVMALVLFFLAMIGVPSGRYNLVAGGLFCITLAVLIERVPLR
jgi:hypothetical protein